MGRVKDYIIWHEEKYGETPRDMGKSAEYLADEKRHREEWARRELTPRVISHLVVESPSIRLLKAIKGKTMSLDDLEWMQFEDVVAELLSNDGYSVQIGKRRKDEGVDIFAERHVAKVGKILTVWQAKKLKAKNKVGLSTIRELADTRLEHKATKGIIVTNTFLTKGAIDRIVRDRYTLGKIDGADLTEWIKKDGGFS